MSNARVTDIDKSLNTQDIVIEAKKITKEFKVPINRSSSLKEHITHPSMIFNKQYHEFTALSGIDLSVKKGEFLGIVGRNGSGKSTLLKILAGIYKPTSGSVKTKGKLVPFIELGVGFNNELTARDNVYLNGAMLGFSRQQMSGMYEEIVDFAELEEFMDQKLKNFSSGMRVRLAFSIAIKAEADILLIDEVLAVGDASFKRKCYDHFKRLKLDNKTVVFVTHDMSAVKTYCDRAVVIENSQIIFEGNSFDAADVYDDLFRSGEDVAKSDDKQNKHRSGNKVIEIVEVDMPASITENDKQITAKIHLKVNKDVDSPVFGFSVKDDTSRHLFGTNTILKEIDTNKYKAGEKITIEWQFPNILHDGLHYLSLAIVDSENNVQYDVIKEAKKFMVSRVERTPYPVAPEIKFSVSDKK